MSTPKGPKTPPPLKDPHEVQERFADDIAGVQMRGDGTWHITFTLSRPNHQMAGLMQNDPDMTRVVTDRLVIPDALVSRFVEIIRQVRAAASQQAAMAAVKGN